MYGSWATAPEQLAKQKSHPEDTPFVVKANLNNLMGGSWQYG
jgi:hypothetical protein